MSKSFTELAVAETGKETRFSPRPFQRSCIFNEHVGASVVALSPKQNIVRVIAFSNKVIQHQDIVLFLLLCKFKVFVLPFNIFNETGKSLTLPFLGAHPLIGNCLEYG